MTQRENMPEYCEAEGPSGEGPVTYNRGCFGETWMGRMVSEATRLVPYIEGGCNEEDLNKRRVSELNPRASGRSRLSSQVGHNSAMLPWLSWLERRSHIYV